MEDILNHISNIYNRKTKLNKMINELPKKKEYGLYLVPDDNFPKCDSVSKGMDWGGAHITLAGFSSDNGRPIESALEELRRKFAIEQKKEWRLRNVHIYPEKYDEKIKSHTQYKIHDSEALSFHLFNILKKYNIQKLKNEFHIYCRNGLPDKSKLKLKDMRWSLIIIVKQDSEVKWMDRSKIILHDFV